MRVVIFLGAKFVKFVKIEKIDRWDIAIFLQVQSIKIVGIRQGYIVKKRFTAWNRGWNQTGYAITSLKNTQNR